MQRNKNKIHFSAVAHCPQHRKYPICLRLVTAKTPKFETSISLFFRTQVHGLLMAHYTGFFPQNINWVDKASLCSPDNITCGRKSKLCYHLLTSVFTNWVKLQSRTQKYPGLFSCNNSTTIIEIVPSEYFFVIYIKNAVTMYFQILAYGPKLCQNAEIWNPIYLFSHTHAPGLLLAHPTSFFPQIFNLANEASLRSPNNMQYTYII